MALFTDGVFATLEELAAYDSPVLSVASTEGIDAGAKLRLAYEALASELGVYLSAERLAQLVVTVPLKKYFIYSTLEQVYRDAYNSQLNDRYEGRWRQYERSRRDAWGKLLESGLGLAEDPVPKPEPPAMTAVSGEGPSGTFYARVSWVNGRGAEGAPSECGSLSVDPGQRLRIDVVGGATGARGWNVYVGRGPEETRQQNGTPLAIGASWLQTAEPGTAGKAPGNGHSASYTKAVPRILRRG